MSAALPAGLTAELSMSDRWLRADLDILNLRHDRWEEAGTEVTIAAFDSGNLLEVARAYRAADPTRPIILAADTTTIFRGVTSRFRTSGGRRPRPPAEVGGAVLLPRLVEADKGTDWNDYVAQHGRQTLRDVVASELVKVGITLPVATPRPAKPNSTDRQAARRTARTSHPVLPEAARQIKERRGRTL